MRTTSKNRFSSYINRSRLILSSDAERARRRLTAELQRAYKVASNYARGRVKYVVGENGKQHPITIAERRYWLLVAARTAQIIDSLTQGIDEQKLYQDLDKLDAILRGATAYETAKSASGNSSVEGQEA